MSFVAPNNVTSSLAMAGVGQVSHPAATKAHPGTGGNTYCRRCNFNGCDVKFMNCGCSVHVRCINVSKNLPLTQCPYCMTPGGVLALYPMSFLEMDAARQNASLKSTKRSKKRKEPGSGYGDDKDDNECRTGRWTQEEMAYCDKLIEVFKAGDLPISDGMKLNDFLATMLKSKQSRLTKKMKNANLSGKIFKRNNGFIADNEQCKKFAEAEDAFLRSLSDPVEQASVKFHMQKEWREMFSSFCVSLGQTLDADAWLSSVEEMEKRESLAKDAARMARRKMMMGIALNQDAQNPDQGVFIERTGANESGGTYDNFSLDHDEFLSLLTDKPYAAGANGKGRVGQSAGERHYWHYSSPFLGKVISYIQRHGCPFEHVDVWVPSFVPDNEASEGSGINNNSTCRLCFAGSATADVQVPLDGVGPAQVLSQDEQFHLLSFGDYSQKFSFNVGCGLPGRVYENGVPAWEQSVQNAPHQHFERCGGAIQWGIKTVVGIPVPSPNVGRIVVVVYSRHDRNKDQDLVGKLYDEFKKLVPCPKWKLVVDIGLQKQTLPTPFQAQHSNSSTTSGVGVGVGGNGNADASVASAGHTERQMRTEKGKDPRVDELVRLLGEHMPHGDPQSPLAQYLSQFMSLRLMLLKPTRTQQEKEVEGTLLSSYSSYKASARNPGDIAVMIANDYMFLQQQHPPAQAPSSQQQQQQQQQHGIVAGNFFNQNQSHGGNVQGYNLAVPPQPQGGGPMDISNHSVIGLVPPPQDNRVQQGTIPDVSNHSHGLIGHSPPNGNGNGNGNGNRA